MKQQLNIGLFGYGVVGSGLYEVLQQSPTADATIRKICVRDLSKTRNLPAERFCSNPEEILNDPDINLVVELIDDAEAAYRIVKTALKRVKSVVSGNKKMLAEHLPEFIDMQQSNGAGLLYDASACGSIPVIRNLEEYYDNDLLKSVTGILNGSSNYILSRMFNDGLGYPEALRLAQELGFAESNPSLDVDGYDALSKLVIITVHAFGLFVPQDRIFRFGISSVNAHDMQFAREKNRKIKLVAQVKKTGDGTLALSVMPRMVTPDKYIYNVEDEFNGVVIKGAFYDKQFMFGRGAGGHPTGSAVLSDITARGYNYRYEYKKMSLKNGLRFSNKNLARIYLRYNDENVLKKLDFKTVLEKHYSADFSYLIGEISLERLLAASNMLAGHDIFISEF